MRHLRARWGEIGRDQTPCSLHVSLQDLPQPDRCRCRVPSPWFRTRTRNNQQEQAIQWRLLCYTWSRSTIIHYIGKPRERKSRVDCRSNQNRPWRRQGNKLRNEISVEPFLRCASLPRCYLQGFRFIDIRSKHSIIRRGNTRCRGYNAKMLWKYLPFQVKPLFNETGIGVVILI